MIQLENSQILGIFFLLISFVFLVFMLINYWIMKKEISMGLNPYYQEYIERQKRYIIAILFTFLPGILFLVLK